MSEMDFTKADTIYKDVKAGLLKYVTDKMGITTSCPGIKLKQNTDEVFITKAVVVVVEEECHRAWRCQYWRW